MSDPGSAVGGCAAADDSPFKWAKVIDHASCIGCHACTTACKSENEVPLGVTRTYVKSVDVGVFPEARRAFQVTRCNQCDDAPCTVACPTSAMYRRDDGIVDFDKNACIGCKACIAACPYDAIFINPEDHSAEKCNFCAHRLDVGLEPACVTVCPTQAILVGDMNDPESRVAQMINRQPVTVRRPEKDTQPKLFYRGAHQGTLDPLAATRPEGGLYMWSEQPAGAHHVGAGHPQADGVGANNSSAAAVLSYDVAHKAPWDWRVSAYTLTKGVASGVYLVMSLLVLNGLGAADGFLWQTLTPVAALLFLALTGGLLISDLEQPKRFFYIFTRPQWRSWLVKGAFIIAAYGLLLTVHGGMGLAGVELGWTTLLGIPLAGLTAVYTAFLFAQAKARDLWQNPLLPAHLLVQAVVAGAAVLLPASMLWEPELSGALARILAVSSLVHLLMVWGESALPQVTAHARLAHREMTSGRFGAYYKASLVLSALALAAPILGPAAALPALLGLAAFEHAYVQAGQSVPLA